MILATIGSNYSLETNSLAVRRRKYLLKYLPEDGPRPALAVLLIQCWEKEEEPLAPISYPVRGMRLRHPPR